METNREFSLHDVGEIASRRMRLLASVTSVVVLITILLVLFLPAVYRSQAIILIEQQEIPSDLVRSTVTSYADQRIQVISQRVMTTSNLMSIIDKYSLYADLREREPREVVIQEMRDNINRQMISADVVDPRSGRPTEATIAFSLSFDDTSPSVAQRVTNELVSLFVNENLKSRAEAAEETTTFLSEEADNLRQQVDALEGKLAAFKGANVNSRPELERVMRDSLDRADLERSEIIRRIHSAEQQKIYLESELAQVEPYRSVDAAGIVTATERLRAVEAELTAAEASYGVTHPDVRRLRKQAEAIRAEVDPGASRSIYETQIEESQANLQDLLERYDAEHPDVVRARRQIENILSKIEALPAEVQAKPNNPAYIALTARLESTRTELASMRAQEQLLQTRIDNLTANLLKVPEAEAELRAITRDYERTYEKYREISAKQMEARLSQNLETERKGEKFTLIEPPQLPEEPAKPNRTAILIIGLFLAVGSGLGAAGLAEALDDKIRGRRGIESVLSAPPLASIPVLPGDEPVRGRGMRMMKWGLTAICVVIASLMMIHIFYKPVDVLWFVALRKLGL